MLRKIIFILSVFVGAGLYSCTGQGNGSLKNLGAAEFSKVIASEGIQLVDVRTPGEYAEKHIRGSLNLDINASDFEKQLGKLNKSKPLYLYCLSGGRSGRAGAWAVKNGFREVYNLEGGILAWTNNQLPVETGNTAASANGMSFDDYLQKVSSGMVLVDFNAVWCGPCKIIKPILGKISKSRAGVVSIMEVDVDKNPAVAKSMHVTGIPLLILYKNGKEVWRKLGVASEQELLSAIDSNKK